MRRPLAALCTAAAAASLLAGSLALPAAATPSAPASSTASSTGHAAVADELLVGYVAGAAAADRARARSRVDARLAERVVAARAGRNEVERVVLPTGRDRGQAVAALQADPAVAYAEPNWVYTRAGKPSSGTTTTTTAGTATVDVVREPSYREGRLWGLQGSGTVPASAFGANAAPAWADGVTGSRQVVVGVIDEGIQVDHPDLAGQVGNPREIAGNRVDDDGNGYVDDVHGWDFVSGDSTVYDGPGAQDDVDDHGTHVAGTIGAKADGSGVVGVNHAVTIISGKFLGPAGGSLANAVKAVDYFTDLKTARGVNVVALNNSWGGGGFSQALLDAIVAAGRAQILFVAAAGNGGTNNDRRASYPSGYSTQAALGYDAVVAVAAIDRAGALASFSQYGAQTVDLGAPGVDVLSTTAPGRYESYSGTSMATPHVTGAAALHASTRSAVTVQGMRTALLSTAVPLASLAGKTVTGGRLDTTAAVRRG